MKNVGGKMPRPVKLRKVAFMPDSVYFKPDGIRKCYLEEVPLKIEELEAMRLKDIEGLSQSECAELMNVSRQTFQLIIDEARKKVAIALTQGKAIKISGGNYTLNICKYSCESCGKEFEAAYENEEVKCPSCGENLVKCLDDDKFCRQRCRKSGCCR